MSRLSRSESAFHSIDKNVDVGRFHYIVVDLMAYGFDRRLESGVSREDDGHATLVHFASGAHHRKPVACLADVKVGEQHVKLLSLYFGNGFRNAAGHHNVESALLQDKWQG